MPKQPTAEEIADARALIARVAAKDADAPQAAMIALVTMAEFDKVLEQMRKASSLNPANVDLSYTLSMMERIRASNAPA